MKSKKTEEVKRTDYQPSSFLIEWTDLVFQLHPVRTRVIAESYFYRNPACHKNDVKTLRLDGKQLRLVEMAMDGKSLALDSMEYDDDGLILRNPPDQFTLRVITEISPQSNTALSGLYRSNDTYCTQCEAEGFRRITYFLDRPDILAKYTTRIEGDRTACPVMLSNGNLVEEGDLEEGRWYCLWSDPYPKPSYLFALVAGDLACIEDRLTTASGNDILLQIYVQQKNRDRCGHAMRSLKKAMRWDEEVYGLEYDLERYMIVAVDDFNMGAMENKGLNIFNSKYVLASPESATDQDYLGIEGVIGHEYFHNWTGNRVTCRDWFQLSLKEGLTVFRDQEFSADMNSRPVQRIQDVRILRNNQFREDAGPMAHPVRPDSYLEINNFYTVTVYNKGAEVVRMLRNILGWHNFRAGMDVYFKRHDGRAVTCEDFVDAMADASGVDLDQFKLWYSQAGTPELEVEEDWNEQTGALEIHITQHLPVTPGQRDKKPFHIPVTVGFLDSQDTGCSGDMDDSRLLEIRRMRESFTFKGFSGKPVLSFLRDFSAPVKVRRFQGREELCRLMSRDSNLFNRWNASATLFSDIIDDAMEAIVQGVDFVVDTRFLKAFEEVLDDGADPALTAEILTMPSETSLAQNLDCIDPDILHRAVMCVREQLAAACHEKLTKIYHRNTGDGGYTIDHQEIGKRTLKNRCLFYLLTPALADDRNIRLCFEQFEKSENMTDVMAALAALSNLECHERKEAFKRFYALWRDDALVVDKWFGLQAASMLPDTLDRVTSLMEHESFDMTNPNKVRALIGTFCQQNHYRFHNESGAGYRFLSRQVLEIDKLNPQVAARLMNPFVSFTRYRQKLKTMMEEQIRFIHQQKTISKDVYEIAERCLADADNQERSNCA